MVRRQNVNQSDGCASFGLTVETVRDPGLMVCLCHVVPPYVLSRLAQSGEPEMADSAKRTLRRDSQLRAARLSPPPPPSRALARATTGSPKRAVFDAEGGTGLPGTKVRAEGDPATSDDSVNNVFAGFGAVWSFFDDLFSRDSIDGSGQELVGTVHYGTDYDNAFWDGTQMVFGDGDGEIFGDFTGSLDVIGHELTHGIIDRTAGLTYSGQSGALNESVSDVFGVLVEQHSRDVDVADADWLIGEELLLPGVRGTGLRNMLHPGTAYDDPRLGTDPQPGSMDGFVETPSDNEGVHINSGIPNRAFAHAAVESQGKAWLTVGPVWYDVLTGTDIRPDCDFATFAALTVNASRARHGGDHTITRAIAAAWALVGVAPATLPTVTDPPPQTGATLTVTRAGGLAGIVRQRTVALDQLPEADASQWTALLASQRLATLTSQGDDHADAFRYDVSTPDRQIASSVPESALSHAERELLRRTLLHGG